ncbi:hypothetical protein ACEQ8H_000225 [Pleosporales sp. CAS-2024a]
MPTPIDRAVSQRGPFFAFAAVITGVAAWSIWGQDLFPSRDPTGRESVPSESIPTRM